MPNPRFSHSLKVSLSDCEMAALTYLHQKTHESMADHIRQAILLHARQHPEFVPSEFVLSAKARFEPKFGGDRLAYFQEQLARYTDDSPDPCEATAVPGVTGFVTDRSLFDEE